MMYFHIMMMKMMKKTGSMEEFYVVKEGMYVRTKKEIARVTKLEADGGKR